MYQLDLNHYYRFYRIPYNDLSDELIDRPHYYSDEDLSKLGLSSSSRIGDIITKLLNEHKNGTIISLYINDSTTYGTTIRSEIQDQLSITNAFGWLKIEVLGSKGVQMVFYVYAIQNQKPIICTKQYNTLNNVTSWSNWVWVTNNNYN